MPLLTLHVFGAVAASACFFLAIVLPKRRRDSLLPPGPPGDPVIGNLRHMPTADSASVFHEWAKTYGVVMYLEVLGRPMVILDTHQAAVDLLEKKSLIYSDRPKFTLYQVLGWTPSLTFLAYGKQFNRHRQMHHSYLNRQKSADFKLMQTQEARTLVKHLMECAPDRYEKFLSRHKAYRFSTGIITQIVAGHRIISDDDPYLRMSNMIYESFSVTGSPGSSLVDFFPMFKYLPSWFPGNRHVGVARAWWSTTRELYDFPLDSVKKQQETGDAEPSFILEYLEEGESEADESDIKGAAATMFAAGEATTWSTLTSFILAMVLHPECQVKAQQEISFVVGDSRLPDFKDRENLPFVECLLQEVLRWNPGLPLGVPHRVMEDDVYCGMLIPKGCLVFPNIKGMSLDDKVYSDPTSFVPERYLPAPAGKGEPYFSNVAFGFGRRICTGQYFADNSLWIAITSILASCTITNAIDDNGSIIVPERVMTDGLETFPSHPSDLRCVIYPRSASAKELIVEAAG
ncbi:cytochrome P450 [Mycena crocata]|nr:cytochrome P450 [Mycena crocata]